LFYIVILAGGKGERFWPRSTKKMPKQFHNIVTDKTMLQETFYRVFPEIEKERIFLILKESLKGVVLDQLPILNEENIIIEPIGKNTAPAIGLAATVLHKRDKNATMVVLSSDHLINPKDEFIKTINTALKLTEEGFLVNFGIKPSRPATEYGYIETGEEIDVDFDLNVYRVKMFREKPSLEEAKEFLREGRFLWNSGMFAFKVDDILASIQRFMPNLYEGLLRIEKSMGTENEYIVKKDEYEKFENISIDYGIMEKAKNIVCIKPEFLWDDVGSWSSLYRHKKGDNNGNIIEGNVVSLNSKNNLVLGEDDSIISLIGVDNLIIVKNKDKILICNNSMDQKVKDILKKMSEDKHYLEFL